MQVTQAELDYTQLVGHGRKFGITGEVGGILVGHKLGLRLAIDPRAEGFDAIDREDRKVQTKTRRAEGRDIPRESSPLSRFSDHRFDYALFGILTPEYALLEVWKATEKSLRRIISRRKRRHPTIDQFKQRGHHVFP